MTDFFLREELTWKDACVKTLINSFLTITSYNHIKDNMILGGSRYYDGSDDNEDGEGTFNNNPLKRKSDDATTVNKKKVSIYDLT